MNTAAARRVGTLVTMLAALVLLALAMAPAARACDCMERSFDEAVEETDLIADVTVKHALSDDAGFITYYVAVDRVWKGEESRTIELGTHTDIPACGLGRLPNGEQLLVWASGADGSYSTSWCALPADGGPDTRERLTEELGEPADLTDEPIPLEADAVPPAVRWAAILGGPILVVALGQRVVVGGVIAVMLVRHRSERR